MSAPPNITPAFSETLIWSPNHPNVYPNDYTQVSNLWSFIYIFENNCLGVETRINKWTNNNGDISNLSCGTQHSVLWRMLWLCGSFLWRHQPSALWWIWVLSTWPYHKHWNNNDIKVLIRLKHRAWRIFSSDLLWCECNHWCDWWAMDGPKIKYLGKFKENYIFKMKQYFYGINQLYFRKMASLYPSECTRRIFQDWRLSCREVFCLQNESKFWVFNTASRLCIFIIFF